MASEPSRDSEEHLFETEFEHRLESVIAQPEWSGMVRPYLYRKTIALAVYDQQANLVWCDDRFEDWIGEDALEPDAVNAAALQENFTTTLAKDCAQRPILLIYTSRDQALGWASFDSQLAAEL